MCSVRCFWSGAGCEGEAFAGSAWIEPQGLGHCCFSSYFPREPGVAALNAVCMISMPLGVNATREIDGETTIDVRIFALSKELSP